MKIRKRIFKAFSFIIVLSILATGFLPISVQKVQAASNEKVDKILAFAKSKEHSAEYSGYCQRFVKECYEAAGIYGTANNALEAKRLWMRSNDLSNIPIGACVYFTYNHVALYVGSGKILGTVSGVYNKETHPEISYVEYMDLSYYIERGKIEGWGYQAGYDLYADGGSTTPTSDIPDTSAFPFANGATYIIRNALSDKAVEVPGGNTTAGTQVKVWSYDTTGNSPWQRWIARQCSDGYMFINIHTGQALDIRDGSTAAGAVLQQYTAHGGGAQRFKVVKESGGYGLININSGLALDLCGSNTANGAIIDQHGWHGKSNQLWKFEEVSPAPVTPEPTPEPTPSDTTVPTISNVRITNSSSSGYTVSCEVTDNVGVDRVQFPTWTENNGQDDLVADWGTNGAVRGTQSGNTWSFRVNISDHNNEYGLYTTHIYAYDTSGNWDAVSVSATVSPVTYNLYISPAGGQFSDGSSAEVTASPQLVYKGTNWNYIGQFTPTRRGFTLEGWYEDDYYLKLGGFANLGSDKIYNADGTPCYEGEYWSNEGYVHQGDLAIYAGWTRNSYTLDVNPTINGTPQWDGLPGYTFTVTVKDAYGNDASGTYGAVNVIDFCKDIPYGYSYTVTPTGNLSGSMVTGCEGVIDATTNYAVPTWSKTNYTLNVDPIIFDRKWEAGLQGYTFSVTVKDTSGKDVSDAYGAANVIDFCKDIPVGYTYTVTPTSVPKGYMANACSGTILAQDNYVNPKWEKAKYSIVYNANNGMGAPGKQTKNYDANITLSDEVPTRTGYKFAGWNTKADGKGKNYKAGAIYKANADVTLYAKWTVDSSYKNQIAKATVTKIKTQTYTGKEIRPDVTVKLNKQELSEGTDYTISYTDNIQAGKATMTITGKGTYVGSKTVTFKIQGKSIAKAKVTGIENKIYSGQEQTQNIKLTVGDVVLTEGSDYTITYKKNLGAGTAAVTIKGINGYTGTVRKTFKIAAYDILKDEQNKITGIPNPSTVTAYETGGCKPEVTLKFAGTELKKGKDYTISYANNKKVTTEDTKVLPTITIKGKGNYKGTVKVTFTIKASDAQNAMALKAVKTETEDTTVSDGDAGTEKVSSGDVSTGDASAEDTSGGAGNVTRTDVEMDSEGGTKDGADAVGTEAEELISDVSDGDIISAPADKIA